MSSAGILDLLPPPADRRIPYGDHSLQFGDLRLPTGPGPHPAAVVIHGGYWRARYDLEHIGSLCAALTRAGIATWNVEYRRIGDGGGWPATFLDVGAAVGWLRVLGPDYEIDLHHAVAVGHSAGGQLALWAAGRPRIPVESGLSRTDPFPLRGAVSLAGVVDLRAAWERQLSGGVVRDLLGGTPEEVPERYNAASPAALLPLGVSQILLHGTDDESVPYELSRDYVARAGALGDCARLVTLRGAGHFEVIDPRTGEWEYVLAAVREALEA